jgi:hypothetical protein
MSLQQSKSLTVTEGGDIRAPMFSADPSAAMREMMQTIDALRQVYVRETGALNTADAKTFMALQDEKLEAARRYQRGVEEMLERREELKNVSPAMKKRLEDMQKEFSGLARQNMEALERMQRIAQRLGNTLRAAAKEAAVRQRGVSYNEIGKMSGNGRKPVSAGSLSETA